MNVDEQSNIGNQRLYVDIRDINATIATACSASSPPSTAEFHILVKAGNKEIVRDVESYNNILESFPP